MQRPGVARNRLAALERYAAGLCVCLAFPGMAQAPAVVKAFHPAGPMPSFEVATIKPVGPDRPLSGMTVRQYIAMAYGVPMPWGLPGAAFEGLQVVSGPEWIDKDHYVIDGKAPDELREARQKMPNEQRWAQDEMMEQSLLAERFHLKVHFETREMSVFELVPAKGGVKITVAEPSSTDQTSGPIKAGEMRPGTLSLSVSKNGLNVINGRGTSIEMLTGALRGQAAEIGGRPIINKTGIAGNFDLKDFRFVGLAYAQGAAAPGNASEPDAPSVSQALEQQLGLKLVRTKGQVEVVVIDSIDRPTEN